VHVGHSVLADGHVSLDGFRSPFVVVVNCLLVDSDFVLENFKDVLKVGSSFMCVVLVNSGDMSGSSVSVDGASVLFKEVRFGADGVVEFSFPVGFNFHGVTESLEGFGTGVVSVDSVLVGIFSSGNGSLVSVDSSLHLVASDSYDTLGTMVSGVPDTGDVSNLSPMGVGSSSVLLGSMEVNKCGFLDFAPVLEMFIPVVAHLVVVLHGLVRMVGFLDCVLHLFVSLLVLAGVVDDYLVGVVDGASLVEVFVDGDVSLSRELRLLSFEFSLLLCVITVGGT